MIRVLAALAVLAVAGCSSFEKDELPDERPPLADLEEPLALHQEPEDEAARAALPLGGFTGITVGDARRSLDRIDEEPTGVRVQRVVENSPGDAAGIEEGDLLLESTAGGTTTELHWPSEWRKAELEAAPGLTLRVLYDRAGDERTADVEVARRVRATPRDEAERFREEARVGVVVRTATEVEARSAGLGPGGGAVIVGLSAGSPWRAAGLRYGNVLVAVDGKPVSHPQVVLDAIRDAEKDAALRLDVVRDGASSSVVAPISQRASEVSKISLPPLLSYESDRGSTELSLLLGLIRHRTTEAAWDWRFLWLLGFGGGDSDRLEEVSR